MKNKNLNSNFALTNWVSGLSKFLARLILIIILYPYFGVSQNINLIKNGSFEDGYFVGDTNTSFNHIPIGSTNVIAWYPTENGFDWHQAIEIGPAYDGFRMIDLTYAYDIGGISQSFSTDIGREYMLKFAFAAPGENLQNPRILHVSVADTNIVFSKTSSSSFPLTWNIESFVFRAVSNITTLTFSGDVEESWGPVIDNVSVVALSFGAIDQPKQNNIIVTDDYLRFVSHSYVSNETINFYWDFGDGRMSSLQNPGLITYSTAGVYTVTLYVSNSLGQVDTTPPTRTITVISTTNSVPDLKASRLGLSGSFNIGQSAAAIQVVTNCGEGSVTNSSWVDALYVSTTTNLDSSATLLASITNTTRLNSGGVYTNKFKFTVPALDEGQYFLISSIDDNYKILEKHKLNNEMTVQIDATTPVLTNGGNCTSSFSSTGEEQIYKIEVTNSGSLLIALGNLGLDVNVEIYVSYETIPTRGSYDYSETTGSSLLISDAVPGTYYIMVRAGTVTKSASYSISASALSVALTSVTPSQSANNQTTTLSLAGSGFDSSSSVTLIGTNGTSYTADSVEVDSYEDITATFNSNTVPAGVYSVQVSSSGSSATLSNVFTMAASGKANLVTDLVVPSEIGYHIVSTIYVEYSNTGDAAMPAPLLLLTATQDATNHLAFLTLDAFRLTQGFWTSAQPDGFSHSIQILGSGGTPGVLQPGESYRVPVYYAGWQQAPQIYGDTLYGWDPNHTPITFNLSVLNADNTNVVDWGSMKDDMKLSTVTSDAWKVIWTSFTNQVGITWGNYVTKLDANASYLGKLDERVVDVSKLLAFELMQADGMGPVSTLSSSVDAAMSAPGLPLVFSRVFSSKISQRFELGDLGYGWSHNWDYTLTNASDGTVTIYGPVGSRRVFQPDSRSSAYFAQTGDRGTLSKVSSGYTLTEPNGLVYAFSSDGTLSYVEDANGNRITASYSGGRLTTLTHSSGQSLELAYYNTGCIKSVMDSLSRQTLFTYDNNHLIVSKDYAGRQTTNTYGTSGVLEHTLQTVAYPGGTHQYYGYNSSGLLTSAWRDGNAEKIGIGYDGGKVSVTNAVSSVSKFYYDHRALLVKTEDALGNAVYMAFDDSYNLSGTTDSAGRSYSYGYDSTGNVLKSTDTLHNVTKFGYTSSLNRLSTLTDANANKTKYGYNSTGNLQSITYADSSVEGWQHDSLGNTLVWTNRRGQAIYYTNDVNGRLTAKLYPSGKLITYGYDLHGNLTNAITFDPVEAVTNVIQMFYDSKDQLTNITYPKNRWLAYTYYDNGQRASMQDQLGHVTGYHYDSVGRLQYLTDENNAEVIRYYYDDAGRLSGKKTANGNYTTNIFDAAGQLLNLINYKKDGTVNSRFDYTYDSRGRRKTMGTIDGSWTYGYDDLGQLTNAVFASSNPAIANQNLGYVYDALGNRLSTTSNGVTTTYVPNELNQYVKVGNTTNVYDADGNLYQEISTNGTTTYTFDEENRLTQIVSPSGTSKYEYDALGNQTTKVDNGLKTTLLVDPIGIGIEVGTFDSSGQCISTYSYGIGLAARRDQYNRSVFYDSDAIGSVVAITGDDGNCKNLYSYQPFGIQSLTVEATANDYCFAGLWGAVQGTNGNVFMMNRIYSPIIGQFLSDDPIGILGDANRRAYVDNMPLTYIDPSGLSQTVTLYIWGGLTGGHAAIEVGNAYLSKYPAERRTSCGNMFTSTTKSYHSKQDDLTSLAFNYSFSVSDTSASRMIAEINRLKNTKDSFNFLGGNCAEDVATVLESGNLIDHKVINSPLSLYLLKDVIGFQGAVQTLAETLTRMVASHDPNEKICPAGYGTNGYVCGTSLMPYKITFENATNATAPAQQVVVTDPLSTNLNWSSFQLTGVGFGDTVIAVPANCQYMETNVSMTYNGVTFEVQIYAGIDLASGQAYAQFYSIDPDTELPPSDVNIGFLPPEDGTGRGEGYVSFTVRPNSGLTTGTVIRNVASISFDNQTVIRTDQVNEDDASQGYDLSKGVNTIDSGAPTSAVVSLPAIETNATFTVAWSGSDENNGSGIASYTIYVSTNGADYAIWLSGTTNDSASFTGVTKSTYSFYSVARDNVGNVESKTNNIADTTTTLDVYGCTLSTNQIIVEAKGGTNTVSVTALGEHAWIVSTTNEWLTILSNSTMTSSGVIRFKSSANTNTISRTGTILVGGQTLSVIQRGTDKVIPTVTIKTPKTKQVITNATFTITGTAADKVKLDSIWYKLNNGDWTQATGTTNWSNTIILTLGTNLLRVYALDANGNASKTNNVSFEYAQYSKLTLRTNGLGTIKNTAGINLKIGQPYTLTATSGKNYSFTNWTGSITSNVAKLTFTMQSNMVLQANFITNPFAFLKTASIYNGLFFNADDISVSNAGPFNVTVNPSGAYSGYLQLAGKKYTLSGQFALDGTVTNSVTINKSNILYACLKLDMTNGNSLSGSFGNTSWSVPITAYKAGQFDKTNTGTYTLIIPGYDDASAQPGGDGFATLSVSANGTTTFVGTLADNTSVSCSACISQEGEYPVYVSLYSNKGLLLGWITFTNESTSDIAGPLVWLKPAQMTTYYANGFTNEIETVGSRYCATNKPVTLFTNGMIWLDASGETTPTTNGLSVSIKNAVTSTNKTLKITLTSKTGLFSGSISNAASKMIEFKGALYQKWTNGYGYFLGTNKTGRVVIEPTH